MHRRSFRTAPDVNGPDDLREALLARSDRFLATLTSKLLIYALGRRLEYYDLPAVRAISARRRSRRLPIHLDGIVMGIVESPPFQMRRTQP